MSQDIATLGIRVDSSGVDKGRVSLDQLARSGEGAEKSTTALTSASSRLVGAMGLLSGALAGLGLSRFITETSALHQRYEQLGLILGVVGSNTGNLRSEIDKTVSSVKNQGISMIESRQTVLKLMQSNIDLSNATKLARLAQDAATIGNVNSSQALDSLIHGVTSAQVEVLRTIGINVSFEQSYKKLADSLGVATTSLTENQKMQARLNEVLGKAPDIAGAYAASMENAGKMMKSTERLTEDLKVSVGGLFDDTAMFAVTVYTESLKTLTGTLEDMKASGGIKDWSQRIAIELAFVADLARTTAGIFVNLGSVVVNQLNNIKNGDFSKMSQTFADSDTELKKLLGNTTKYQDAVNNRIVQESLLTEKITGSNNNLRQTARETETNTGATKKLTAAKKELTLAMLRQQDSTKATIDLHEDVSRLTESVMTKQEKYNRTLEELNRLKPYLAVETYNRALAKAQVELDGVATVTKTTTDDVSQLWIQAGRNIQSTLSNSIFDFFNSGLSGMLANAKNTVLRIASEFAGLNLAKGLGLQQMFSGAANAGGFGGGFGGGAGGGSGITGMASSAFNMFKTGGAISQGVSSLFSAGGTQLAAQQGASALWGASGAASGGMSGMASGMAAFAGPAIALVAVDQIGRMLAGDKKLGGAEMIPVVGGFLAAMFGRGPMKFRQQSLQGDMSSEGFDGDITNVFRAKGGLFMGNKHKSVTEQFSPEMQGLFDSTIGGFFKAARDASKNLGMDGSLIDNFTKTVQIKSEKNKKLTEEAITDMLTGFGEDLARTALPTIDTFKRIGETAISALSRLSGEFSVLTGATQLLFNMSSEQAKTLVRSYSISQSSGLVDQAGGADVLAANVAGFAQNFLTDAQRMRPVIESIVSQRDALGLSGINTREQFSGAVQSGKLSAEQMLFLLSNQGVADQIFKYIESKASVNNATSVRYGNNDQAKAEAESIDKYGIISRMFQTTIDGFNGVIDKLKSYSDSLQDTALAINPLSRSDAKSQLAAAITEAQSRGVGGVPDIAALKTQLAALTGLSEGGFSSRASFSREQSSGLGLIDGLRGLVDKQAARMNANLQILSGGQRSYMSDNVASFDIGGRVPKTGLAMIHKNEQILTPGESGDIVGLLKQLISEVVIGNADVRKTADTLVRVTRDGETLRTTAA